MPRFGFGEPQLLPLVVLAPLLACLYLWLAARRRASERLYSGTSATALRSASYSSRRFRLKAALIVAAAVLLALAAARPQIGTHRTLLQREGTDVIIAFDVSLSMSAADVQPSRLERAKAAVSALLQHLGGDRVGLVTFAGDAQLRFPITTDTAAAQQVVQSLSFKDGGLATGTSISSALRETTDGFANDQTRSKVVVLVSDGEDLGDDAASAAQFVQTQGITLDTIGVGTGAPTPMLQTDSRGNTTPRLVNGVPETTTADPAALQQLASANGGHFYSGNSDDFAVQLADEIGRLQKTRFDSGQGDLPVEQFQWFAGLALLLLLVELLMPAGRRSSNAARRRFVLMPVRGRLSSKAVPPPAPFAERADSQPAAGGD